MVASGIEDEVRQCMGLFANLGHALGIGEVGSPRLVWGNRALAGLLAYRPEELEGLPLKRIWPPEHHDLLERFVREIEQVGHVAQEVDLLRKDGSRVPALVSGSLLRDDEGRPRYRYLAVQDLSEVRRLRGRTRQVEEMLRALAGATPDPVFFKDLDGRYALVNPAAARAFGTTVDEAVGQPDGALFDAEVAERFRDVDHRVRETGETVEADDELVVDGQTRFFHTVKMPWRDGDGHIVGVMGIARDVTERRRAEEEASSALGAAEVASEELRAFNYSIAHDLRAPLRNIHHLQRFLAEDYTDTLDERGKDYLAKMQDAVERMNSMITDLLDLSRLTTRTLERQEVDLAAVAREVVEELRQREAGRDVRFQAPSELRVQADPMLARRLLENLLGNAWKFTRREPDPQVELGTEGDWIVVRDNGIGFDMKYVDRLFAPFKRLPGAQDVEGTGVGLAAALRIVRLHGGAIEAEGRPGEGATFRFTLS